MTIRSTYITPLLLVTATASITAWAYSGHLARPLLGTHTLPLQFAMLTIYAATALVFFLHDSARLAPRFSQKEGGHVDILALASAVKKPGAISFVLVLIAGHGIASSFSLVDVYRATAIEWHDHIYWAREKRLFEILLNSPFNVPRVWDAVYQALWLFVFLALAGLGKSGRLWRMSEVYVL